LGFLVRVSRARWELIITVKHPVMADREFNVKTTLENQDGVRQTRSWRARATLALGRPPRCMMLK